MMYGEGQDTLEMVSAAKRGPDIDGGYLLPEPMYHGI